MSDPWQTLADVVDPVLSGYPLITALAVVGAVMAASNWASRRLTAGRVHGSAIAIFVGLLIVSVVGFIIGQAQAGKKFSLQDKSEEEPTPHVYELMGQSAPSGD